MQTVNAGPGDEATWGPITSRADPRADCSKVTFPARIGNDNVVVEVTAEVWNFGAHPLGEILRVEFEDIDILKTLVDTQMQDIASQFEEWSRDE